MPSYIDSQNVIGASNYTPKHLRAKLGENWERRLTIEQLAIVRFLIRTTLFWDGEDRYRTSERHFYSHIGVGVKHESYTSVSHVIREGTDTRVWAKQYAHPYNSINYSVCNYIWRNNIESLNDLVHAMERNNVMSDSYGRFTKKVVDSNTDLNAPGAGSLDKLKADQLAILADQYKSVDKLADEMRNASNTGALDADDLTQLSEIKRIIKEKMDNVANGDYDDYEPLTQSDADTSGDSQSQSDSDTDTQEPPYTSDDFEPKDDSGNTSDDTDPIPWDSEPEPTPTIDTTPTPPESDMDWWKRRLRECIAYLEREGTDTRDIVSNAPYKLGARMIAVGIPKEAALNAFTLTWDEKAKADLQIPHYDPQTYGENKEGQHKATAYVEALLFAQVPVFLIGPSQAGKGYLCQGIAENMGLQYESSPMNAGVPLSWLFGRNLVDGFKSTGFLRVYSEGGLYLFDEIDASDSNLLLAVNDAISNWELSNPVEDKRYLKHKECYLLAAGNTPGSGANADYTGRERLDAATLERFRMGRVLIDYDRDMQEWIADKEYAEWSALAADRNGN